MSEPFEQVKKLCNAQLPFGIAETRQDVRGTAELSLQEETNYFHPNKHTVLWSCIFARPGNAIQRFYQWQRQRKMWWRKVILYQLTIYLEAWIYKSHSSLVGNLTLKVLKYNFFVIMLLLVISRARILMTYHLSFLVR